MERTEQLQKVNACASVVPGAARVVGVLFDIDRLGGGAYGWSACKAFFALVDPKRIAGSVLYDGDTAGTLRGEERRYCIAVESEDLSVVDYVRETMEQSTEAGLLPRHERIVEGQAVRTHPLGRAAYVDRNGRLTQKTGFLRLSALDELLEKWTSTPPTIGGEK